MEVSIAEYEIPIPKTFFLFRIYFLGKKKSSLGGLSLANIHSEMVKGQGPCYKLGECKILQTNACLIFS